MQEAESDNKKATTQIHEMRVKLTKDMQRGDEIWSAARRYFAFESLEKLTGTRLNRSGSLLRE